ncbi:MAG: B12-binding domain-containing radical SAM protein [Candidatus Geothermincolia bacterium]
MKITFVYPDYFETQDVHTEPQGRVYLGIGYLAAVLKRGGHSVNLIHVIEPVPRDELIGAVRESEPDLVALSATTLQFSKVREIARWVKEDTGLPTACGGVHPTIAPEETIADESIDYICVGEGEYALLELCEALEAGRPTDCIASIWSKRDGAVARNDVRPLVEDLDTIPFPDRGIFDSAKFAPNQRKRLTMMASRGCPFNCSYCCNHLQRAIYPNGKKYVRFRSPANVIEEIETARRDDPEIEQVRFDDDILTMDRAWFREFASLYKERVGLPFICNARVDLLNDEMVRLLAEAGCSAIAMGVESGNYWLRKNVLGRPMTDDKILRAFALCRDAGIPTVSLNMVGFPHETISMALDTVKMNAEIDPGLAQITALCPFPNTRMFELCKDGGMIGDATPDTLFSGRSQLELDRMSRAQVQMICENIVLLMVAYRKCAALPQPLSSVATFALDSLIKTRLIPQGIRERMLESRRYKLDWKYFIGVDY